MVISIGIFGTHGIMSLMTYIFPGLAVDLVLIVSRHRGCCLGCCFVSGIAANISRYFFGKPCVFQAALNTPCA
jgi:hypothetical protein